MFLYTLSFPVLQSQTKDLYRQNTEDPVYNLFSDTKSFGYLLIYLIVYSSDMFLVLRSGWSSNNL